MKDKDTRALRVNVMLVAALIVGILLGALLGGSISESSLTFFSFGGVYDSKAGWLSVFLSYFVSSAAFVTASFLMGFCAVSHPLELLLVAFKGLGLGALARNIYSCTDIASRILLFVPFSVLSCGILILQSCDSVQMSTRYLSLSVTSENQIGMANEFRGYIFKFVLYLIACGVIAALNCLAMRLISGVF